MKITILGLITFAYYIGLYFLNKKKKIAFEERVKSSLGNTTDLKPNESEEENVFGKVNRSFESEGLLDLSSLMDTDSDLEKNLNNIISVEAEESLSNIISEEENVMVPDEGKVIDSAKKKAIVPVEEKEKTIPLVGYANTVKVLPIKKKHLVEALEKRDNQDELIHEADIDNLMSLIMSEG